MTCKKKISPSVIVMFGDVIIWACETKPMNCFPLYRVYMSLQSL